MLKLDWPTRSPRATCCSRGHLQDKTSFNPFHRKDGIERRSSFETLWAPCWWRHTSRDSSFENVLQIATLQHSFLNVFVNKFFVLLSVHFYCTRRVETHTGKIIHTVIRTFTHSSIRVLNFMLPAYKPNSAKFPAPYGRQSKPVFKTNAN